jgi:hypothetical protein
MSVFRHSFKMSGGLSGLLGRYEFDDLDVLYAGNWSRLLSPSHDRAASEFTLGRENCLPGTLNFPSPNPESFTSVIARPGGFAILADSGYNIFHYIWEHLTSLYEHREFLGDKESLVIGSSDQGPSTFNEPLLRLLGINCKVTQIPLRSRVNLKDTTYLGSFPYRVYPIELVQEIVEEILQNLKFSLPQSNGGGMEVVFLGRGDAERNRRHILNEAEALDVIRQFHPQVRVVRGGLLALSETINLIRQARLIIAPSGGSNVHHIWAQNLEGFIEIVPTALPGVSEFEETTRLFGVHYEKAVSESIIEGGGLYWTAQDQNVDLRSLRSALAKFAS